MEPMADQSLSVREGMERGKLRGGVKGKFAGEKRKREEEGAAHDSVKGAEEVAAAERAKKKQKVKGPRGANPLSVKKPKKHKPQLNDEGVPQHAPTDGGLKPEDIRSVDEDDISETVGTKPNTKTKRKRKHKSANSRSAGDDDEVLVAQEND